MASAAVQTRFQATGEDRTAAAFNSVAGKLDGMAKKAKIAGAIVAGAFLFKKALDGVGRLSNEMADLPTEAARVGMAIPEYQKMNSMFGHLIDGGKELTQRLIPDMNEKLASPRARQALDAMGVSMDELADMSSAQRFEKITVALAGMPNELERGRAAALVFGSAAKDIAPMLRMGPDALTDALANVGQSIGTVDDQQAAMANKFRDGMEMAGATIQSALMSKLGELMMKFESSFGDIDAIIMKGGATIMWLGETIFHTIHDATTNAGMVIGRLVSNINDIPSALLDALKAWWEGAKAYFMAVVNLGKNVGAFFKALGVQIWRAMTGKGFDKKAVADAFAEVMDAGAEAVDKGLGMYVDAGEAFAKKMKLDELEFQSTDIEKLADRYAKIDKDIAAKRAAEEAMAANAAGGAIGDAMVDAGETVADKISDAMAPDAKWLEAGSAEAAKIMYNRPETAGSPRLDENMVVAANAIERVADNVGRSHTLAADSRRVWGQIATAVAAQLREIQNMASDTKNINRSLSTLGVI